ncbi:TrbI/VirB10 family protein [Sphingomonas sp. 1P08PE]|uniref:TrbI/VirB10 family protein n=1 Tax=Sphingomonas sp. 1P08PE TaxID=554122 RepID=UPI0039A02850
MAPHEVAEVVETLPAKVDPETLVLRAKPPRAIRFKRGAVVAVAAMASVSLIATVWVALKPSAFHIVGNDASRDVAAVAPTEALAALPTSYDGVPKLGRPLPGDLGKPILDHERATTGLDLPSAPAASPRAIDVQREQAIAQATAARESALLVTSSTRQPAAPDAPVVAAGPRPVPGAAISAPTLPDAEREPGGQQRKAEFVAGSDRAGAFDPHTVAPPASSAPLSAGSVINAALITGLRSDLPGLVIAQVTERVFDSATGRVLLIPQGARLIGTYDSVIAFGQQRALVVWQRILFPDGSSLQIDNVPATDPAGYAGLADKVDFHSWTLLKGVGISTLLGVGSTLSLAGESDLVQALRQSTQQSATRAGDQLTSKNLQVQPTITVRPGAPVRLVVHRDLILPPWHS